MSITVTVERHEDQWIAPTISIPLIPAIAFFWERLGVERDLIGELPKMRRAGRTYVRVLQVSFNELTPVSKPLYAVA